MNDIGLAGCNEQIRAATATLQQYLDSVEQHRRRLQENMRQQEEAESHRRLNERRREQEEYESRFQNLKELQLIGYDLRVC